MSTSLVTARRKLAQELGHFGVFTASGGSGTTLISGNAFQSANLPSTHLAYAWIFVPAMTGNRQRRVTSGGLDPLTGTITLDNALSRAIVNGDIFEVHTKLPAIREPATNDSQSTMMGLYEAIQLGLSHVLIEDTITQPLTNGINDYNLTQPWLDRKSRLLDIREPNATGTTRRSTTRKWEFREDPDGAVLHFEQPFRFSSGAPTIDLVVLRPADTKIGVLGAAPTDSTVGLVNETDVCSLDEKQIVAIAKVFCYQALRDLRSQTSSGKYDAMYQAQLQAVRALRVGTNGGYDIDNDIDPTVPGLQTAAAQASPGGAAGAPSAQQLLAQAGGRP